MIPVRVPLIALVLAAALAPIGPAQGEERSSVADQAAGDLSGADDFDSLMGEWRVQHRVYRSIQNGQWSEFEGSCINRGLMEGRANVEEHRFERPTGVTYGVAIRVYDPKSAQWAIWWIDSRVPHNPMDPPTIGAFKDGVGTFYSDSTLDGKPIRVRFIWSEITTNSARWEQAYSEDAGKTWPTNWIMKFRRQGEPSRS